MISATITAMGDATFNYSAASYCTNDVLQTPTITGTAGGSFTVVPATGLTVDPATGEFDPSTCLLYTSPSPRDQRGSRMPSSA